MTRLVAAGSNHRLAAPSRLEPLAARSDAVLARILELKELGEIDGAVVLATCNRFEVVLDARTSCRADAVDHVLQAPADLPLFRLRDAAAIEHLLATVAGLESIAIGEDQIVHQVKRAFQQSEHRGLLSGPLRNLRNRVLHAARGIRTESGLTRLGSSIASIAARRLRRAGRSFAVVGTGDTGRLAARELATDADELLVVNRTRERAERLAGFLGCRSTSLDDFLAHPPEMDGLLIAIKCRRPLITPGHARRFRTIVDVSMPSAVDPAARRLAATSYVDLDVLAAHAGAEAERLATPIELAHRLVQPRAARIHAALDQRLRSISGVVEHHIKTAMTVIDEELSRALGHLSPEDKERVRSAMLLSAKRQAHYHIQDLKQAVAS